MPSPTRSVVYMMKSPIQLSMLKCIRPFKNHHTGKFDAMGKSVFCVTEIGFHIKSGTILWGRETTLSVTEKHNNAHLLKC
jgi:hypothetical protein